MLWIAFLALVFAFGLSVSQRFFREESVFAAFPVGVMFTTWAVFLLSLIFGFNITSIAVSSILLLACTLLLGIKQVQFDRHQLIVFIISLAFFAFLNHLMVWNFDSNGNALSAVVVDVNYHSAIISPMGWGDNFPPLYPYLPDSSLTYHFLFDFFSAILLKLGSGLQMAMQIPNAVVGASFVTLLYVMLRKLNLGSKTAMLAVFLILFNGSFGFIEFFRDLGSIPQGELVPSLLKMGAASVWMPERGYIMANTITEFTLNQRMFMTGIAVFAIVVILLLDSVEKNYIFAALIAGLSPLFHIYSFAAIMFFSLPLALLNRKKEFLFFFLIVVLLAVPQIMQMMEPRTEGYVQFRPGWVGEPQSNWFSERQDVFGVWLKNFSPYIVLAALGMLFAGLPLQLMTAFAFIMFILVNLFVTQPLMQDNRKWLLFVLILFSASSAVFLSWVARRFRKAGWVVAALLVLILTLGGIQTVVEWAENYNQVMFYNDELRICEFVRENTEADAVIISNMHRDCVNNWGGRRVFLRVDYESETWYNGHGLDTASMEEDMRRMLWGDCELIRKNGVGYILVDSRNGDFAPRSSFIGRMERMYENSTFSLYRVGC